MKSGLILFALMVLPRLSAAELLLGVTPGDACDAVYQMEVDRGAEPALARDEMIRQGMLGFERTGPKTREISVYHCEHGVVTSVSHGVGFDTEKAQRRYFQEQREAMEQRFGDPELDTFNLTLWERLLLWFEGVKETVERFQTVYWTLEQGQSALLSLSERPNQRRRYLVTLALNTESTVSSGPGPETEQAPD